MNFATGTKERNGPQRIKSRESSLTLVSNAGLPKRIYNIAICENVFSQRQGGLRKTEPTVQDLTAAIAAAGGENQKAQTSESMETLITYAVLGLVLGYLVGKLDR
ncbi:MAG TPA: hypothetical protein VMZ26_07130 [Pyrinomonadaceae bacterium]|nr:hypothetical protein [Pyrinomonadaceae bacterium]